MDLKIGQLMEREDSDRMAFFSFGMFIIDEIEYFTTTSNTSSRPPPKKDLPGGAGLYALLGARILSPPPHSHRLSWILDVGSDLAPTSPLLTQIKFWNTSTVIRRDDSRLTTRAWNGYGFGSGSDDTGDDKQNVDSEHRAFKYLTPKRRLNVEDLTDPQLTSRSWHLVCSPNRCREIVTKLDDRLYSQQQQQQQQEQQHSSSPLSSNQVESNQPFLNQRIIVWEPIPDLCSPDELINLQHALKSGHGGVQVVSPNAEELANFFVVDNKNSNNNTLSQDEMVQKFMGWELSTTTAHKPSSDHPTQIPTTQENLSCNNCICIVREGKNGSTVYLPPSITISTSTSTSSSSSSISKPKEIHIPAYHNTTLQTKIKDPTGAGNTYLGALALVLGHLLTTTTHPVPLPLSPPSNRNTEYKSHNQIITQTFTRLFPPSSSTSSPHNHNHNQTHNQNLMKIYTTASILANVAAGLAIEQTGVPSLLSTTDKEGDPEGEFWNDEEQGIKSNVTDRIHEYLDREGRGILDQVFSAVWIDR